MKRAKLISHLVVRGSGDYIFLTSALGKRNLCLALVGHRRSRGPGSSSLCIGRRGVGCRNPRIEQSPLLGSFEFPTSFNLDYRLIRDGGLQAETIFLFSIVTSISIVRAAVLGAYLDPIFSCSICTVIANGSCFIPTPFLTSDMLKVLLISFV